MAVWQDLTKYLEQHGTDLLLRFAKAFVIFFAAFIVGRIAASIARAALSKSGASAFSTFVPGTLRAIIVVIGVVMALDHVGLDVSTLLAGAGVAGLAIGFGSQTVVKDVVTGFFLVVDGALKPGDHVKIGDCAGSVENIGLRMTEIRGDGGELYYVSNGSIGTISNRSRSWTRITLEVPLSHDRELGPALEQLQAILDDFATEYEPLLLEPPEAQALVGLDKETATVRLVAKVRVHGRDEAKMSLLRRVREAFYFTHEAAANKQEAAT